MVESLEYYKAAGTQNCHTRAQTVTMPERCGMAAHALGLRWHDNVAEGVKLGDRPPGCYWDAKDGRAYFNWNFEAWSISARYGAVCNMLDQPGVQNAASKYGDWWSLPHEPKRFVKVQAATTCRDKKHVINTFDQCKVAARQLGAGMAVGILDTVDAPGGCFWRRSGALRTLRGMKGGDINHVIRSEKFYFNKGRSPILAGMGTWGGVGAVCHINTKCSHTRCLMVQMHRSYFHGSSLHQLAIDESFDDDSRREGATTKDGRTGRYWVMRIRHSNREQRCHAHARAGSATTVTGAGLNARTNVDVDIGAGAHGGGGFHCAKTHRNGATRDHMGACECHMHGAHPNGALSPHSIGSSEGLPPPMPLHSLVGAEAKDIRTPTGCDCLLDLYEAIGRKTGKPQTAGLSCATRARVPAHAAAVQWGQICRLTTTKARCELLTVTQTNGLVVPACAWDVAPYATHTGAAILSSNGGARMGAQIAGPLGGLTM